MADDNSIIWEMIENCREKIDRYSDYKYYLDDAANYCEEAGSGITLLANDQYEKVKSNCIDGIGEQAALLTALKFNTNSIDKANENISDEIKIGISIIEQKLENLRNELTNLYSRL